MAFNWPRLASSETPDRTFHTIARAVTFHRIDRVVVSRSGLKSVDTHTEIRVGMVTIQPDVGFRGLAEVLRVRAVGHDAEMLIATSGISARPPDDGPIAVGRFQ